MEIYSVSEMRRLIAQNINAKSDPALVSKIQRLGYKPLTSDQVFSSLSSLAASPREVIRSVGWAVISDGSGIWPTSSFATAFKRFKLQIPKENLVSFVSECLEKDPENLLAFSVAASEGLDSKTRSKISSNQEAKNYELCGIFDPESLSILTAVGSYLADLNVPWKDISVDDLTSRIRNIFVRAWNFMISKGRISNDELYSAVADLDNSSSDLFRSSHHFMCVEPEGALRLNIQINAHTANEINELFMKVAKMFAVLSKFGKHTIVKFTKSDFDLSVGYGPYPMRFCMYVPTCALIDTLDAFRVADLDNGTLVDVAYPSPMSTTLLLPNMTILRTTGEGGLVSKAQGMEALAAVGGISYIPISVTQRNSNNLNGKVRLTDGSILDLFED